MSAAPSTLNKAIAHVQAESGGVLALYVIRPDDTEHLFAGVLAGDAEATQVFVAATEMLQRIHAAKATTPMQCGCCGSDLQPRRFALAIATPDVADPSAGLGLAICRRCGSSPGRIKAAALVALRLIWPGGRFVTPTHPDGGRA